MKNRIKPKKPNKHLLLLPACVTLAVTSGSATADLIAYDGFDYAAGPLTGQNGGFGWASPWQPQTQYNGGTNAGNVITAGLTYPGLSISGGAFEALPNYEFGGREFFDPEVNTGVYYLSFLYAKQPSASGYGGVSFWGNNNGNEYFYNDAFPVPDVPNDATLVVWKMDLDAGIYQSFINPVVGDPEPAPTATFGGPNSLQAFGINSEGGYILDEIRLGETFLDVTPVPEPTSAVLLLGSLALMARRRR
jgi:hypothetical protein